MTKRVVKRHRRIKRHHHHQKMPANVLAYFKYRNAGMSKAQAKKRAGL